MRCARRFIIIVSEQFKNFPIISKPEFFELGKCKMKFDDFALGALIYFESFLLLKAYETRYEHQLLIKKFEVSKTWVSRFCPVLRADVVQIFCWKMWDFKAMSLFFAKNKWSVYSSIVKVSRTICPMVHFFTESNLIQSLDTLEMTTNFLEVVENLKKKWISTSIWHDKCFFFSAFK